MIRGAVFDFDYTLYDRDESDRIAMRDFYREHRAMIAPDISLEAAQAAFVEAEHRHNYDGWKRICEYLTETGIFPQMPDWRMICGYWQRKIAESGAKYPFTEPVLDELRRRGLKLGLITNGQWEYQTGKVKGLGLWDAFDCVLVGCDPATAKPHPDLFLEMARRLGRECGELIYVGDNPVKDVDAARRAGYVPVWVRTLGDWRYPEVPRAECEVDTVAEIPALIDAINGESREERA